jgi:hypothetical protein
LDRAAAEGMVKRAPKLSGVLFPFLTADDMLGEPDSQPTRYVIDFQSKDIIEASTYSELFRRVKEHVLPDRKKAAVEEKIRNKEATDSDPSAHVNHHHANFLAHWWQLSYDRGDLIAAVSNLPRYIVCGSVTKRPIFDFVHPTIHPNAALTVFALADDYSFGVLQSGLHWAWFLERCSTLKSDFRYTSNTVYDSFPWPQAVSASQLKSVAKAGRDLRRARRAAMKKNDLTLRKLYRAAEMPGQNPIREVQEALDSAVREAYGMTSKDETLPFLLSLNLELAAIESKGGKITKPGLQKSAGRAGYLTDDCIRLE